MKLKQYPKYKESNIDFLNNIPIDWSVYRLKFLISALESGKREPEEETPFENGAFSLGGEHVNWDGTLKLDNVRLVSEGFYDSMNQGKIKINDVLLVKDGATIGKTALVKKKEHGKMCVNEHVFILRPNKKLNSRLLYYLIYSDCGFSQIKLTETGSAQGGVNSEFTSNVSFSISEDSKEQKQIADFLDKKTIKINSLLKKDAHLIELLAEKRIALINQVVTKGLNPKVKFKDSGIDWIGKVPEHWEVRKIDKLSSVNRGASPRPIDDPKYFDDGGGYAWVRIADLTASDRYLLKTTEKLSLLGKSLSVPLEPNKLFISIAGTVGKPIITKIKCCIHDGFVYFRNLKVNNEYLYYIFIGGQAYQGLGKLGTQLNLNTETIGIIPIPYPPKTEQTQIVEYLDKATSYIDKIMKKIKKKMKLLEEYKRSLIHNVVTGKVDVRGGESYNE